MVLACTVPAEVHAQGVVEDEYIARRVDGPEPVAAALSATVVKFIEAQKPFESHRPIGAAKPLSGWSASVHSLRDSILVSVARTQIGTRYVRGGEAPERGFDCSGLVRYVLGGFHIPLPRTAAEQALTGLSVGQDTNRLRPGDLITFAKSKHAVSHIGIYLGNGRFVHASSAAGRVIESDLARPKSPRIKPWRDTRRVVSGSDDDAAVKGDS
jgi:cell wall-associated NlpC family hydrolase